MISAMPAVAIRRERSKSVEHMRLPTRRSRFVEYYHRKISRISSIRPSTRSYSTATTPDTEMPPELLVCVDPYDGRCPTLRRILGYVSLFHAGCVLIVVGLVVLFLSMGSIKADIVAMRALGSFFVALGALLCLLRTIFFKKPQSHHHHHVLRLRSSESFATRPDAALVQERCSPAITMEVLRGLNATGAPPDSQSTDTSGLLKSTSPLHRPKADTNGTRRNSSPLRPNTADKMLPGPIDEEKFL